MSFFSNLFRSSNSFCFLDDDFFPYATFLSDEICILKNGDIIQVLEFEIKDFRLNHETGFRKSLQDALSSLCQDKNNSYWIHTIKKKNNTFFDKDEKYDMKQHDFFVEIMKKEYAKKEAILNNYEIVVCLSIIRHTPDIKVNRKDIFGIDSSSSIWKSIEKEAEILSSVSHKICDRMQNYSPKILGSYLNGSDKYSELTSFFGYFANFDTKEYIFEERSISNQINNSRFKFDTGEIKILNDKNQKIKYLSVFSLKEKSDISIKTLTDIVNIPGEILISEYVCYVDPEKHRGKFSKQMTIFNASDDEAFINKAGLDFLKDNNLNYYIESSVAFIFIAENQEKLNDITDFIENRFREYGLLAVQEDISSQRIFHSIAPGNFKFVSRKSITSPKNIAPLAYSYTPTIPTLDNFFKKTIIAKFGTLKGNPVIFGLPLSNQNILISGPKVSGKTTLTNFIALEMKDKFDAKIYTIETRSKSKSMIDAISGEYFQVSLNKSFNNVFFNPFGVQFEKIEERQSYIAEVLMLLVANNQVIITQEILQEIRSIAFEIGKLEKPVFYETRHLFAGKLIEKELERWHSIGKDYFLFDNKKDCIELSGDKDVGIYIDHTIQKNTQLMNLVIYHILAKILSIQKKEKISIIILDEPFFLFQDIFFKSKIQPLINLAKERGIIFIFKCEDYILESTSPNSFDDITKTETQFHFGSNSIDQSYSEIFSLEKYEYLSLKTLYRMKHNFLLRQKGITTSIYFDLSIFNKILLILSDDLETRKEIISIKEDLQTEDPRRWVNSFLYRKMDVATVEKESDIKSELEAIIKSEELLG